MKKLLLTGLTLMSVLTMPMVASAAETKAAQTQAAQTQVVEAQKPPAMCQSFYDLATSVMALRQQGAPEDTLLEAATKRYTNSPKQGIDDFIYSSTKEVIKLAYKAEIQPTEALKIESMQQYGYMVFGGCMEMLKANQSLQSK